MKSIILFCPCWLRNGVDWSYEVLRDSFEKGVEWQCEWLEDQHLHLTEFNSIEISASGEDILHYSHFVNGRKRD